MNGGNNSILLEGLKAACPAVKCTTAPACVHGTAATSDRIFNSGWVWRAPAGYLLTLLDVPDKPVRSKLRLSKFLSPFL